MLRIRVYLLLRSMTSGMFKNLYRGKFYLRTTILCPPVSLGMHDEERRSNITDFPQQSNRTL